LAGLASRHFLHLFPGFFGKYPGDTLWALMVFFGWSVVFRTASIGRIAILALAVSYGVELLKLWETPWWVGVRHSTAGHLVFGQVFSWQNLVAYTLGVALGVVVEFVALPDRRPSREVTLLPPEATKDGP
jgi:hypothetical protein